MKRIAALGLAFAVLVAAKPVPVSPSFSIADGSDWRYGGEVWFDVVGDSPKLRLQVDVQCYGPTGVDNVGWWDSGSASRHFVLGSEPTTAPPDLGSVIYLEWTGPLDMECTARLYSGSRKMTVYQSIFVPVTS